MNAILVNWRKGEYTVHMKIQCKECGVSRDVRVDPKHESKESYENRRSFCKKCSNIRRMKVLGGHSPNWNGGKHVDLKGYVRIWVGKGYRKEHHVVWEEKYGKIPKNLIIHHKDGNKENNNIENLECISKKEHDKMNPGIIDAWKYRWGYLKTKKNKNGKNK